MSLSSIKLWNSLPDDLKRKNSLSSFKNALITYFRDSYIDIDRMFTGFWVIEFDVFQSDPNINSDPISFYRAR